MKKYNVSQSLSLEEIIAKLTDGLDKSFTKGGIEAVLKMLEQNAIQNTNGYSNTIVLEELIVLLEDGIIEDGIRDFITRCEWDESDFNYDDVIDLELLEERANEIAEWAIVLNDDNIIYKRFW